MQSRVVRISADVMAELDKRGEEIGSSRINNILRHLLGMPGLPKFRKYRVDDLAVGEHKVFPLRPNGDQRPMVKSVNTQSKELGRKFDLSVCAAGYKFTRVL